MDAMTVHKMRPEDQLQKTVAQILDASGLVWSATANGAFLQGNAQQRAIRGMRMKQHGVKNGLPDCLIFQPFADPGSDESDRDLNEVRGYWINGLAIELKVGKNKPSASQEEWGGKLRGCGWRVETLRSVDEVLTVLRKCYAERFPI
jgi:hypothetical protein